MHRALQLLTLAAGLVAVGCGGSEITTGRPPGSGATGAGSSSGSTSAGGTTTTGSSTGAATTTSGGTGGTSTSGGSICSTQRCVVYASSDHDLYQVDPTTAAETHLCSFNGALASTDVVTDIAVERQGTLYAITTTALFTVDPATCTATRLASLSSAGTRWVGLSFTAGGVLLAANGTGDVVSIDPASGQLTPAGSFGGTLACSGDLVAINDTAGTIYASAVDTTCTTCNDQLVTLDPRTYQAHVVGDLGHRSVYGLGYWAGKLYGFTHAGYTLEIDPKTGASTVIQSPGASVVKFSGGATTPLAPVVN